jgi:hypothetical protein
MRPLSKAQKEFLERHKKLKQEHAEMVDMLRIVSSRLHAVGFPRLKSGVDELLNKIKENGN